MSKYLVLYRSEAALDGPGVAEMMANSPPEQMQAGMAMWTAWYEKCGGAVVDLGAPLEKPTTATAEGASPGKSSITGFSILQADSKEAAAALMEGHPHFFAPGSSVEIFEFVPMPGM